MKVATRSESSNSISTPRVEDGVPIDKPRQTKWMLIKGPEPIGDGYVSDPRGGRGPAWTYSRKEAEEMCPPGYRIVDANEWIKLYNARQAERRKTAGAKTLTKEKAR